MATSLSSMNSNNAQNFPMGSNPVEVNAQTGSRRASPRSARSGPPPLPSSIVNESTINGMQLHDYGFMGSWSTSSSFHINNQTSFHNSSGIGIPSKPIPNPQMSNSGEPQFQNEGNNNNISTFDIPIHDINAHTGGHFGTSQVQQPDYSALALPAYTGTQMDQFGQPRFHQGDTTARQTIPVLDGNMGPSTMADIDMIMLQRRNSNCQHQL